MPSSVLAEKKTASWFRQLGLGHSTSLVRGRDGSARTSCKITVRSRWLCLISFLGHQRTLTLGFQGYPSVCFC